MATAKPGSLKQARHVATRQAKRAVTGGWIEGLERWGYVTRGVLYLIMGGLALQLATGNGGQNSDLVGALKVIARQPYGKVLLIAMIAGLAGYALWGLARAVFDVLGKGSDAKGLLQRAGYLVSAVSYGALILPAYQLLGGPNAAGSSPGSPQGITGQLMSKPYGLALVELFGVFWIVSGLGQLYLAVSAAFMHDLSARHMRAVERRWAKALGQIGYAARAVVYTTLGYFVLRAAATANPQQAQGISGALAKLLQQPNGHLVLGLVAAGLMIFGLFSVLSARWYSIEPVRPG